MQAALAFAFVLTFALMAAGQQAAAVPARITQPVDLENLVTLRGNTHPLARPEYDQGAAPDNLSAERMLLVLQRSPAQEAALRKLLDEQQIKASPNYHMWLTPEQFGEQFGPADADIQAVTGWLASQGFQVSHVAAGRTVIEFSGTAGQVRQAFHTEIHKFVANGEEHWANASDPQIPAALAPVVAGFASMNNFPRKPLSRVLGTFSKSKATGEVKPLFTFPYKTGYLLGVGPGDFGTIYNLTPLWNAGINGTGQTIAIVAQTNINIQDVADFRTMFNVVPLNNLPTVILNGPDPGILAATGDEGEADTDVQWAGSVAPNATIDFVVSQGTELTQGIDLSAMYIIDNNLAPVMSESYGGCEAALGSGGNAFYNTLWEQGAAQGITILMAIGDSGSAGCDSGSSGELAAQYGLAVDGLGSTPFNVGVGGTDFNEGTGSNWELYWNYSTSGSVYPSALSYIPEMTWNDTCANSGVAGDCTAARISSDQAISPGEDLVAGGGGPSNCATSTSTACTAGYPKPSWQTGPGVPADSLRDTPDVSLFAGDGANGSFYVFCEMDANATIGGSSSSCDLNSPYTDFMGAGGTSVSAQAFGGIMALVNQKTGQRQGNANYVLYPLAAKTGASCGSNATMASGASSSACIFYDTQAGNNSVACVGGTLNCSNTNGTTGQFGILVNPNNTAQPAWTTSAGYDLGTGLGTVNAANLVNNWSSVSFTPTTTVLTITPPSGYTLTNIPHGQSVTFNIGVTSTSGTPTGNVSLVGGPSGGTLGTGPFTLGSGGTASGATVMLPGGSYNVTAHYAGDGIHGASDSAAVPVTVSAENSKTLLQLATETCSGTTYGATTVQYGSSIVCSGVLYLGYWLKVDVTNSSGSLNPADPGGVAGGCINSSGLPAYQCPTGYVTVTNNGGAITDAGAPADDTPGTYNLNSQGYAEDQFIELPVGTDSLIASYTPHPIAPNNSYNTSTSATTTITVTPAPTTTIVTSSQSSVTSGTSVTLTATVNTNSIGLPPSGTVQFLNGSTPITNTVTYTPANAPTSSTNPYASLTATVTSPALTAAGSFTAQYLGNANYSQSAVSAPVAVSISTGAPDFSLAANPASIIIASPGQSENTYVSAGPIAGFTGTVSVTCSVQATMSYSSCSFNPTSFTVPGGQSILTVNTTAPSTALRRFNSPGWFIPSAGALFACVLLLLIPGRKRRAKLAFGLLAFALLAAALVACGGGSGTSVTSNPGTPTGSYTVTVTATSGSGTSAITHSLNIPVAVQ